MQHDYNVKLPETSLLHVFWRKCRTSVSFTFFFTAAYFHLDCCPLAFLILSPQLQSFHVVLPTKKWLLCFFSGWASLAYRLFSLCLCLSLALYSKFVDMKINLLSLILKTPRTQKQSPLSVFVFIDCLVVSVLQDAGGYTMPAKVTSSLRLGCHTCSWLSYFTLVCLWCRRTVARYTVMWLPDFLGWEDLLSYGAPHAREELRYNGRSL